MNAAAPEARVWTRVDTLALVGITLFAFTLRLVYLFQMDDMPLFLRPAFDGQRYLEWAAEIASGDWLGREVFFQAPLYPYLLGLLEVVFGTDERSLWWIRVVQIGLGALACGFLFLAGRALFSRAAGVAAGLILALYGPAVFHDGLIQKTVLDLFLITLLLALVAAGAVRPGAPRFFACGAVLGLLVLTRENTLVWVPLLLAWPWLGHGDQERRRRVLRSALVAAGVAAMLLPVGLRNLFVGGEFTLTTSQLGTNFYLGNHAGADGTYETLGANWGSQPLEQEGFRRLAERAAGRPLSALEVSDYWLDLSRDWIQEHPLDWIKLLGRKALLAWNWREMEDTDDFYLYAEWAPLLRALGVLGRFGVLAPLAALGAALTFSCRRELWLLHCFLLTLTVSIALFFVFGRYRFSMVPVLTLFAGAGVVETWTCFRARRFGQLSAAGATAVLVAIPVHLHMLDRPIPSATGYNNLADAYDALGRKPEALATYQRALELAPADAQVRYNLANLLASVGRLAEAEEQLHAVLAAEPGFAEAHNNLGIVLRRQKRPGEALAEFERAVELEPELFEARMNLGRALANHQRLAEAEEHLLQASLLQPASKEARADLAEVRRSRGREPER